MPPKFKPGDLIFYIGPIPHEFYLILEVIQVGRKICYKVFTYNRRYKTLSEACFEPDGFETRTIFSL